MNIYVESLNKIIFIQSFFIRPQILKLLTIKYDHY